MGFGFVYMLNSSFIALLASVESESCSHHLALPARALTLGLPRFVDTAVPAVTGALWLFRTAGQVIGVASASAIMQAVLNVSLASRITGHDSAKVRHSLFPLPRRRRD